MNQEKIGKFIAGCRKNKKLTQEKLGEELGVTYKAVSKWENGRCLPDVSLYEDLCQILGITLNELFAGEYIPKEKVAEQAEENVISILKTDNKKIKKLKNIIIISISIFILILLSIIGMYFHFSHQFTFYDTLKLNWNITIPNNIEEVYHKDSGASFHGDGQRYTICNGNNIYNFYDNFIEEKNTELEEEINSLYSSLEISKENQCNFEHKYLWKKIDDKEDGSYMYILYDREVEKIYFYENIL